MKLTDWISELQVKKVKTTHMVIAVLVLIIIALIFFGWYYFIAGRSPVDAPFISPASNYEYKFSIYDPQNLKRPLGVAAGDDGSIYVTDSINHTVAVFNPQGKFKYKFGGSGKAAGKFNYPVNILVRGSKLYVADFYNHRIQVLSLEGKPLSSIPSARDMDKLAGPLMPVGLAIDSDGNLFVSDVNQQRIVVFDSKGEFQRSFGRAGSKPGEISYVNGLAIDDDEDSRIYLADSNNARIDVFSLDGKFLKILDKSGTLTNPKGIAFDKKSDRIYVTDTLSHLVKGIELDGKLFEVFGGRGIDKGQFNFPTGVTIDDRGRMYVADRENNRVQVFDRN